jgi:hypothetical protein
MSTINKIILEYKNDYKKALTEKDKILEILDYPYFKYFTSEERIRENFNRLINIKPHVINHSYFIDNVRLQPHELKFEGMYVLIMSRDNEFWEVDEISDYFNEECRTKCLFFGSKGTTRDYYRNHLDLIIKHLEEKNLEINIQNIRDIIFNFGKRYGFGECSTFKPKYLRFIIDHFNAKNILDMSMGWGDRLIAAMASNIDCYHGYDPNPCLHPNYKKIIDFFKPQLVNKNAKFEHYELPFEKAQLQDNFYDLMFTSPPYFDIEIYDSNSETQSTHNKNETNWYNNYLKVWINLIYKALKINGIMAFNINQFKHHHFVNWLINDLRKDNRWKFLGTVGYINKVIKNVQPIFIWKKNIA